MSRIRFFNTFEPVVSLYRDLFPILSSEGIEAEAVVSALNYRTREKLQADNTLLGRVVTVPHLPPGRLGRRLTPASYSVGAALRSLFGRTADLNVFLTQPPLFNAWGCALKVLRRQKFIVINMDLYPWVAIEAGLISRHSVLARVLSAVSLKVARHADKLVVIGRCMADFLVSLGLPQSKLTFIPNWCNLDVVKPVARFSNPLIDELDLKCKFVVMYSGNFGVSHYFDDLLAVARRLAHREDIVFLFSGTGKRLQEVRTNATKNRLGNCRFVPFQPYERLAESLSVADVHFVSLRNGFEGLVVPSKAYGVLAAGRPILYQGRVNGEIARMISEHDAGWVVPQGDSQTLESIIVACAGNDGHCTEKGTRARALAEKSYSHSSGVTAYVTLFRSLLSQTT